MAEREQKRKQSTTRSDEVVEAVPPQTKQGDKLKADPREIGGRRVERTNRIDGVKFIFADGSWLLLRPSGTEPVVRIYAESESAKDLEVLLEQGHKFLLG